MGYINSGLLFLSAILPAWAVRTIELFSEFAPLSWIVAGFLGATAWIILRLIWVFAKNLAVKAQYNAKLLEKGSVINPLDLTFEGERIFLNDFVLPSHQIIEGKTFINCDIIGPAIVYFPTGNQASEIRPPIVDGVWLHPNKKFANGFIFINCIFRQCSFQRITILASIENYLEWKDNENLNWVSIPPNDIDIEIRERDLGINQKLPNSPNEQSEEAHQEETPE